MPIRKPTETAFEVSLLPDSDEQKALDIKNSDESQLVVLNSEDDSAEESGKNSNKEILVRKVRFNARAVGRDNMSPSPDGRYLSFPNHYSANLAILDLTTGESRDITDDGTWAGASQMALDSVWSPDGKQIAYMWYGGGQDGLRIVGIDGSEQRVLYTNTPSSSISICYDWSEDGKYILAKLVKKTDENKQLREIVLVSVADGSLRTLKSQVGASDGMALSPDNRYLVYDRPVKEHEDLRDIFLLATDGSGQETRLTEHPANDYGPIWSPDGKSIVFVSNRTPDRTASLWFMQIVDGKPAGEPQLVKKEVGDISTLGFTDSGSLFYVTMTRWSDIYVASVGMETGKLSSTPELLPSRGFNTMPTWSPDGESLAYVSKRIPPGSFRSRQVLVIRSMDTGEEREFLSVPSSYLEGQLRWSPDGRSILCGGRPGNSIHLIDVQTGHVTADLATGNEGISAKVIWGPAWSPDGKAIFFTRMRREKEDWPCRIVALDLETLKERELYPGGSRGSFLAVSPDGRQLAFRENDRIKVIPTEGGESRTILNKKDLNLREIGFFGAPFAWTPDGRYVLFVIETDNITQLWQVSAEGGIPQKLLEGWGAFYPISAYPLSLHPDGRRVALQKGRNRQVDLWVMENLLPISTASR